jgi:hypothetical protein
MQIGIFKYAWCPLKILVSSVVNIFPSAALTAAQNKTKTLPVGRESTHDFQNIIIKKEEN